MEVAADPNDFMLVYNALDKNDALYQAVREVIDNLKSGNIVGVRLKQNRIPKYYLKKHDINAVFKVDLPGYWRMIYGLTTIHNEKKVLLMDLFDHETYNKRFGY